MEKLLKLAIICLVGLTCGYSANADWQAGQAGKSHFKVDSPGQTLNLIALQLYGKSTKWRKIAEWNHIQAPFTIRIGQKLTLLEQPRGTLDEQHGRVLAYWRKRFGVDTPSRAIASIPAMEDAKEVKSLTAVAPVQAVDPALEHDLVRAKENFTKHHFEAAFSMMEKAVQKTQDQQPGRFPAAVTSEGATENVSASEPSGPLESKGLVWFDNHTADVVYFTLKDVPETAVPDGSSVPGMEDSAKSCTRKVGVNLICVRCPDPDRIPAASDATVSDKPGAVPSLFFETRCAGFAGR